jgi:hypothetical protein
MMVYPTPRAEITSQGLKVHKIAIFPTTILGAPID